MQTNWYLCFVYIKPEQRNDPGKDHTGLGSDDINKILVNSIFVKW